VDLKVYGLSRIPEIRLLRHDNVTEWSARRDITGTQIKSDRTALHEDDRVMAVLSSWSRRQPDHVLGLNLVHDLFKADCRKMVALVHDQMPVLGNEILDFSFPLQTLYQANINNTGSRRFAAADVANRLRW
jgi:hypothetical protein